MTISLIPAGQPHGQRQVNETVAEEAGLAQRTSQAPPAPPSVAPPPRPSPVPFEPGSFDALAARQPGEFSGLRPDPESRVLNELAASPHPALRDIARRLQGFS